MTVWTPAELRTFLSTIERNRNEALFRLMALTGIRRGEAVGLRWSDFSLERRRMTVNQAATVIDGEEYVDAPKTRAATPSGADPAVAVAQQGQVRVMIWCSVTCGGGGSAMSVT